MSDDHRSGAGRSARRSRVELLDKARTLARRGRRTVEDLAQRILDRASSAVAASPDPPGPRSDAAPREAALAPEALQQVDAELPELPTSYGDHRVTLVARDPQWLFCGWDVPEEARAPWLARKGQITLRLHDVTDMDVDGGNAWSEHRYPLNEEAREWYLPVPAPERSYRAEVGYELPDGRFVALGRSAASPVLVAGPAPPAEPVFAEADPDRPLQAPPPLAPARSAGPPAPPLVAPPRIAPGALVAIPRPPSAGPGGPVPSPPSAPGRSGPPHGPDPAVMDGGPRPWSASLWSASVLHGEGRAR